MGVSTTFIDKNELFWCTMSSVLDIIVSLLCQVIFIMEVGVCEIHDVETVVTIAIALYFIFELDDRIMDIDPHNRTRYRREVLRSTIEDEEESKIKMRWVKSMAAVGVWI